MDPLSIGVVAYAVSGVVGNESHRQVRVAIEKVLKTLQEGGLPANGDLQRAIRKSYLQATVVLLEARVRELSAGQQTLLLSRQRGIPSDEEEVLWLKSVLHSGLLPELSRRTEIGVEPLVEIEKQGLLLQVDGSTAQELAQQLRTQLHLYVLEELRQRFGYETRFPSARLKALLQHGWPQPGKDGTTAHLMWFDLVCAYFTDALKTDEHVRSVFEAKSLAHLVVNDVEVRGSAIIAQFATWADPIEKALGGIQNILIGIDFKLDTVLTNQTTLLEIAHRTEDILVRAWQPAAATSPFMVPYFKSECLGRDDVLANLTQLLADAGATVILHGIGGIGKTFLASNLAHQEKVRFPGGVFWLNLATANDLKKEIAACDGPTGLNLPNLDNLDERVARVRTAWQEDTPRLIVLDNLEEPTMLRQLQPITGGCRLLITSRSANWSTFPKMQLVQLDELKDDIALKLLCQSRAKRTGQPFEAIAAQPAAPAIAAALGNLPLALAVAGAYLARYPDLTLHGYLAKLRTEALGHRSLSGGLAVQLPTGHEENITATFRISYDQLRSATPEDIEALAVLHRAALLAPAPIPRSLLLRLGTPAPEPGEPDGPVADGLNRLLSLGLLTPTTTEAIHLHPLISLFLQCATETHTEIELVANALCIVAEYTWAAGYPQGGLPYLSHLQHLLDKLDSSNDSVVPWLCSTLAGLLLSQGDYASARPLFERALAMREEALGPTHLDTVACMNNLASLLHAQRDYANARSLFERALAIRYQTLGPSHPDTATSMNNLGRVLQDQGNYSAARPFLEAALVIEETTLWPLHPSISMSLDNLACLLLSQGDYASARPLFERALAMREEALGPIHPDTAASLNNLAILLQEQRDDTNAQPLFERALAIRKEALGPIHPDTATSMNNLALNLYYQGDNAKARPLFERALASWEQALGPTHPDIANGLNNLALLEQAEGNYTTARSLFERALVISEKGLGPMHPNTVTIRKSINNLPS